MKRSAPMRRTGLKRAPAKVPAPDSRAGVAAKAKAQAKARGRMFWRKRRLEVLKRDGRICQVCGRPGNVVDHIERLGSRVPRGRYNPDAPENRLENLQLLCQICSDEKDGGMRVIR